ncbi:uncharacterized protein N0V89_012112 [Didymosphaeria variabile]|uniref:Uncharacterized protein n=1 Tax=Didymosphaeria variabile TaxID=1932322 RepID=A0A9W8X8J1_9PLEO|nr:uncharacterized protein N0V89_012112 [Didymosphaeria variabile]KAJ4344372.1 hypothetical protein N0V89_012112 [Didymosphaeria variabile]
MAPTAKNATLNVPKTMTLGPPKRSKKTARTQTRPKKATKQATLPQGYRVLKKPVSGSCAVSKILKQTTEAGVVPNSSSEEATAPSIRSLLAQREEDLAWQRRELARQDKARDRRAEQIATRGFFHKGRWIRPEVKEPFIIKVERGTKGTEDNPIEIHDEDSSRHIASEKDTLAVDTARYLRLRKARVESDSKVDNADEGRPRMGRGPDITSSFDHRYPHIAELLEDKMLDEQDDAGSLCDFVATDEGSDGGDMDVDG